MAQAHELRHRGHERRWEKGQRGTTPKNLDSSTRPSLPHRGGHRDFVGGTPGHVDRRRDRDSGAEGELTMTSAELDAKLAGLEKMTEGVPKMIRKAVERVLDGLPPGALDRLRCNLAEAFQP